MPGIKFCIIIFLNCILSGCLAPHDQLPELPFERPETGVYGQLTAADNEVASLWVYAYRSAEGNFRGPADFAARAEEDGRYLLDLLPGRWFLVARSRSQGPLSGPPRPGDAFASYAQNPLELAASQVERVDFLLRQTGKNLLRSNRLSRGDTGFSGRLLGPDRQPALGAMVLAYRGPDFRRMPDYSSAAVSEDGRFTLYVPGAGRYCLLAREKSRGQLRQGELQGQLGKGEAACRKLVSGQILDVGEIHLTPFLR